MEYVAGPSLANLIRQQGTAVAAGPRTGRTDRLETSPTNTGPRLREDREDKDHLCPSHEAAESLRQPLPTELIREIFRQLLEALAAAHDAGLIHRDVKPANILLDCRLEIADWRLPTAADSGDQAHSSIPNRQSPIVKLADFGLARMRGTQTQLTLPDSILGTPEYMSPEQARGDEEIDHRTDLYSAGVVLYEMLTGRTPFKAETPTATIHRILHDEPEHPRKLTKDADPALASLAVRLMAKRPADRFASTQGAIEALDTRCGVRSLASRRRLRRWTLVAVAVVVVLAVVIVWRARLARDWEIAVDSQPAAAWITAVKIDEVKRTTLLVQRGAGRNLEGFKEFPEKAEYISGAELVDLDGHGQMIVVVGVFGPVDGCCLFAFDPLGEKLWRKDMSSELAWPDDAPPTNWACRCLTVGNLNDEPGDEIVVVASDPAEYPTRLSIIDSTDGSIRSTFWHTGHIDGVRIEHGFFEDGSPAIIAWGCNNKLDGFNDGWFEGEKQLARWDIVNVVMVLDPADMDGLGPPWTKRFPELRIARPFAYAFLDIPIRRGVSKVLMSKDGRRETVLRDLAWDELGRIHILRAASRTGKNHPWFEFVIAAPDNEERPIGRDILTINRDLDLVLARPISGDDEEREEYWRPDWHPIIQNREYMDD